MKIIFMQLSPSKAQIYSQLCFPLNATDPRNKKRKTVTIYIFKFSFLDRKRKEKILDRTVKRIQRI